MSVMTRRRPAARATRPPARPVSVPAPRAADTPDVDSVREAIRGTTRRTVVLSGAWSVPVVATAVAAPAFAASQTICNACSGGAPVNCTITVVVGNPNTGPCNCSNGLVCGKVLNFLSVCVATNLLATDCGGTTCNGVCLTAGGTLVGAINGLVAGFDALDIPGCRVDVSGAIPTNVCAVPATNPLAGTLGSLCIISSGTSVHSVAITALVSALGGALGGLLFATQCAPGFSCKTGVAVTTQGGQCLGSTNLRVGFCQC